MTTDATPVPRLPVLIAEPNADRWNELAAAAHGVSRVVGGAWPEVRARLSEGTGLVVFGPSYADEQHLLEIEALDLQRHGVLGVLVAEAVDEALLRRAMAAGLREVLSRVAAEIDLPAALVRLVDHLDPDAAPQTSRAPGRLIAVTGAKSGVGTSTVAANVAVDLAAAGRDVVLVDADVQFGDLPLLLGVRPTVGLADVVGMEGRLTAHRLQGLLTRHEPSGLRLLAAPRGPESGCAVGAREIVMALEAAVELAEIVVVDTPPGLGDLALAVFDEADAIALVTVPSATALHDLGLELGVLDRLHLRSKTQLVVNREVPERVISRRRLEARSGVRVAGFVPDSPDVVEAEFVGRPVVGHRRSRVASSLRELASALVDAPLPVG